MDGNQKMPKKARMVPGLEVKKKPPQPPLGKISEQHFVRLKWYGDRSNSECGNIATKLYKKYVCKEEHNMHGSEDTVDVERYKKSLETMLKKHNVDGKPIFVRAAQHDSNNNPLFKLGWFKKYSSGNPVCVDALGNHYFEVTDKELIDDLKSIRMSGTKRKELEEASVMHQESNQQLADPTVSQSLSTVSSTSTEFAPNITGKLGPESSDSLSLHETLRDKIKACKTVEDCVDVYEGAIFQECLRVLRTSKQQYVEAFPTSPGWHAVNEWAKHWAEGMIKDLSWADVIEQCRKTASRLLFKVCDLWNFIGDDKPEDEQVLVKFGKRRIDHIIVHVLVLDRANSLYYMAVDLNDVPLVRGLCWYSTYDTEARTTADPPMPPNSSNHSINKRYVWLHHKLYSGNQDKDNANANAITSWVEIAFPPRLQVESVPIMDPERAKKARDSALTAKVQQSKAKRQEAAQKKAKQEASARALLAQEMYHIGSVAPPPVSPLNQMPVRQEHQLGVPLPQDLPLVPQVVATQASFARQQESTQQLTMLPQPPMLAPALEQTGGPQGLLPQQQHLVSPPGTSRQGGLLGASLQDLPPFSLQDSVDEADEMLGILHLPDDQGGAV